jgi:signal transduction histidine kinase
MLLYYSLVLVNAAISLAVAGVVYWRNRRQPVGPWFAATMIALAVWLVGFAQYFRPHQAGAALTWAKLTFTAALLTYPLVLRTICTVVERVPRWRWWIVAAWASGGLLALLVWTGPVVAGMRASPDFSHYVQLQRGWRWLIGAHTVFWPWLAFGILAVSARQAVGYRRNQYLYFLVAWVTTFLTTSAVLLPLDFGVDLPPFGFFVLPVNLALLGYVLARARLADFHAVFARVTLHAVTLSIVSAVTLMFVAAATLLRPDFLNAEQVLFIVLLVVGTGLALGATQPRLLPRAERMMQERLFGRRYGYQDALTNLVRELSRLPTIDHVLGKVAATIYAQMRVSRALVYAQDTLTGHYRLRAQGGLGLEQTANIQGLADNCAIFQQLRQTQDTIVREELPKLADAVSALTLQREMDQLGVVVCVPMLLDDLLVGMIAVGDKASRDMFFVSDLKLLETLATEVALAVKYRHMEEQLLRQNKLVELGTVAAGVAHEIRNPLASIKTFAQLLPDRMHDPEFAGGFSKLVISDVDRITKTVETMLAFARPGQVVVDDHKVDDLVEEAAMLVRPRLKKKRIELTKQFHAQPVVKADKQQILQVLVNLFSNAVDALPEQGRIVVATGTGFLNGERNTPCAVIEVADNGPGIPPTHLPRLFDPFFTTKADGTGLGLSISQKIVRDHGGLITVNSAEGRGTTFQVNLPLTCR